MDIDKMDKKELIDKISDEIISKLKKTSSSDNLSFKSDSGNKNIQGSSVGGKLQINTPADIAHYIDHTLLKPDATEAQVQKLCEEAVQYGFCTVCVNSSWVEYCAKKLN